MTEKPGDGIRSLRTSNAFRVLNFELYTKPNKVIIGFGLIAMAGSLGYIAYMRHQYQALGYQSLISDDEEVLVRKKSKWER